MATPTDPLYDDQWHFALMGDIETIWEDYDGSGVSVVVYDDGFEYTHEDLDANYDASMHFTYDGITYDPFPESSGDAHGTACAGLVGAESDNGVGGTGVASGATLTGVNFLEDIQFQSDEIYNASMLWAANFDIMTNSWGFALGFTAGQNLSDPTSAVSNDVNLWSQVVAEGRDGLGTVIVKAAGNETANANNDGINVARHSITVAATDENGDATYYTNYGSTILIAGPASAVTTDLSGNFGYNGAGGFDGDSFPADYTSDFGGTSAATPTVAGVIALMLDANENLGWRDVHNILALSASHTGSDLGGPGELEEIGSWQLVGGNTWNGGGTMFHQSYGHGMVNAYGAVRMAEAWDVIYPNALTSANERSATGNYSGPVVAISDNDGVAGTGQASVDIAVANSIKIENIEVTLTMTHSDARNLNIWLEAPDGTRIQMLNADDTGGRFMDNGKTWVFGVDCLRGYDSEGTWTVVVEDTVTGDIGTIDDASIQFFGSASTVDTVFTFTDDFGALAEIESSRTEIDDLDGGIDWLNFAAMTGDLSVRIGGTGEIELDGDFLAEMAGGSDEIENVFMGDGDDSVFGNSLANEIHGMRGTDLLRGANGTDKLYGEDGRDTLHGDTGDDKIWGGDDSDQLYGSQGKDQLRGEQGNDSFVFATNAGVDRIFDFENDTDTLKLDDAIWGGGLTKSQLIDEYAIVKDGNTVFNFGDGNKITILGVTDTSIFLNDITII